MLHHLEGATIQIANLVNFKVVILKRMAIRPNIWHTFKFLKEFSAQISCKSRQAVQGLHSPSALNFMTDW